MSDSKSPNSKQYYLTLSCNDVKGIVATVTNFLAQHDGFIIESAQYGDPSTNRFFMRTVFEAGEKSPDEATLNQKFEQDVAKKFDMDWHLYSKSRKPRVLIMVSKDSHCLNDLLHRYSTETLDIDLAAVASNHKDFEELVTWYKIPFFHLPVNADTREEQEQHLWTLIQDQHIDLVVLARYMQILTPFITEKMPGQIINIHHSFLPSFKGAKPYHQAHERGVKLIGATAHYVNDELDEGPIIDQEVIRVNHTHTPQELINLGFDIESQVLSRAVKYHIEHRVLLNGCKTVVFR